MKQRERVIHVWKAIHVIEGNAFSEKRVLVVKDATEGKAQELTKIAEALTQLRARVGHLVPLFRRYAITFQIVRHERRWIALQRFVNEKDEKDVGVGVGE